MGFIKTSDGDEGKIIKIVQGTDNGPEILEVIHEKKTPASNPPPNKKEDEKPILH